MTDPNKIIEVKNLVKHYGNFKAVEEVTFDVYKGDVFGFLGPNGAGKSTTIRTILSLIKPTAGEIRLFGKELSKNRNYILSKIGCIVEKPDFYLYLSAQKNLEIFGRVSGTNITQNNIHQMLEFVGLKGREKDQVSGFSHGMKQRLGIAQTLLHNPQLIILDEPTTGLDPQGIIDIRNLILQLRNEQNKTVVLSSHILSEIELIANRMVIINKGKTIVQGSVADLLNQNDVIVLFGVSNTQKAMQVLTQQLPQNNYTILDNKIQVAISNEKIPIINKLLCDNQIDVFSIESKRKLEDYFLKLINA
ncbi:MAG: ABC transporter ATP-binding protein [Sphingobacteriales bacterium]|nr:ABC transporter ATP-binding protein [Sphingobacteriales bacterium]